MEAGECDKYVLCIIRAILYIENPVNKTLFCMKNE